MGRIIKKAERGAQEPVSAAKNDSLALEMIGAAAAAGRIHIAAEDHIIDLALSVARRIIGKSVELDGEVLSSIYSQALEAAGDLVTGTVRVHPEDRAPGRIDELATACGFEVLDDPGVERAGCRVVAADVEVDARLEAVLGALERAMKGRNRV